ncbi:MAG: NAD(+)/NADH kinase [Candidatus Omnitrophica bacterium]|nr:NAD(+)/NADH kinase [Candidatus Omnitrophota bacterium]
MQKIGIFHNPQKEKAITFAHTISDWLIKQKKVVQDIVSDNEEKSISSLDLIICVGGDGSLLKLSSFLRGASVPIVGVNAGNLGFLTHVKEDEIFEELNQIFSGDYECEERLMLTVTIVRNNKVHASFHVLNDVVISREGLARFLGIEVKVDNSTVTSFGGDGVIVATPTGSSAYSLSAGGPFLYPTLEAMVITPLCPHSLKRSTCVVPAHVTISITARGEGEDEHACVLLDGQEKKTIGSCDTVTVTKAPYSFRLIKSSRREYFDIVNEKF